MRIVLLFILLLVTVFSTVESRRLKYRKGLAAAPKLDKEAHVVLIAGSNGWYNYRHQADVAHSYQTLRNHGIPAENIITLMYDDVANNKMNPYKGKLFNKPHGKDVYKGLKIDYSGSDVTTRNFINVLQGNASGVIGGNGRVLNTNQDDRVFVYFTDHGAVGLISFPDEILTAKQLNDALVSMHKNGKFGQLVFYLEACESGSMFDSVLRDDLNIYAITAANGKESSWGTYCENDMNLPCLGDLFSVNWITDSDGEDLNTETLQYQYELVKTETNLSHVMQFGDLSIAKESVGLFQGDKEDREYTSMDSDEISAVESVNWPSRDVELNHLKSQLLRTNSEHQMGVIEKKIKKIRSTRKIIKKSIHWLVEKLVEDEDIQLENLSIHRPVLDLDCHHRIMHTFDNNCIDLNKYDYALKYMNIFNNLCLEVEDEDELLEKMEDLCTSLDIEKMINDETRTI
ncbi:unnamed protein product [Caenorhabditis angaria]|uniref:legumain n=1 Tax=Caenorhabditis angaria TaxID=860376 RepID=A0A9P1ITJ9_9PELO|nr:unnamed protein product [Caenorhabditis angaria]